jgi:putative salt-induced outer membrane protein
MPLSTVLTALAALAIATPALAQEKPPPPRQEGTAELAFVGTTGNTSTSTFSVGGDHYFRPMGWVIRNRALAIHSTSNDVTTADSFLYFFRAERAINARLSAFGEYAYFSDDLAGVPHRNTTIGGLSYKIATGPTHTFTVDGGAGYMNEQRLVGLDISSAVYSAGTFYKWAISENAELTDDIRLIGTFETGDDWRAAHVISLTAKLTSLLSLKVSSMLRYVNVPPPGFKTTDTTTSVALVASFKRQ